MPRKSTALSVITGLLGAFLLLVNSSVAAVTVAELQAAGKLQIKTWIEPDADIIARQQLKLQIEVATDKSFSGGTRIGHIEVKDAIVLQREDFALNSIREAGDTTWTVQQWTLVVYPQRNGEFEIPRVPLTLSILGEDFKPITGQAKTQPLTFTVGQPAALLDQPAWVATSRFEVEEAFDKSLEDLKPGDALQRTIRISADNLPAMMLPPVLTDGVPGIAAYAKPAQLSDKVNRGDYLAERSQKITYVIEKSGDYQLPEQRFFWWNLESEEVETIVLPAHDLIVAGVPGQAEADSEMAQPGVVERLTNLLPVIYRFAPYGMVLLILLWLARRWFVSHDRKATATTEPSKGWLLKQARLACRQNNDAGALDYLYQWMRYQGLSPDSIAMQVSALVDGELKQAYDGVMRALYTQENASSSDTWRFIKQFTDAIEKRQKPRFSLQWNVDLKLN